MRICGIIVEYNPLHNGHLYHINEVKKCGSYDLLIAVMSGNFVQRGEPSILDKHIRTELALKAGVDIVIELPYLYAVSHADLFSLGAITLLNACSVNEIVFGSETNDTKLLKKAADGINTKTFDDLVKDFLKSGLSYPEASHHALSKLIGFKTELLSNDLLGLQYIRMIQKINPNISFKTIKRIHTNYKEKTIHHDKIASATSIREALLKNKSISDYIPYDIEVIKNNKLHTWDDYFPYLKYAIYSQQAHLKDIHDISEGLENALIQNMKHANNFSSYLDVLISKRYTKGRIQRILTHVLNHITKKDAENIWNGPQYVRLLGFNQDKSNYIKTIKNNSTLPFITNINKSNHHLVELDLKTSNIYHLIDKQAERKIPILYHQENT